MFQTLIDSRRRTRRALVLAGVATWLAGGCSLVTAMTDLDSEASRADAGGALDAGETAAPAADGQGPIADTSLDRDAVGDAASNMGCEGPHALCDDFDDKPLGDLSIWTSATPGLRGASLALVDASFVSAPRSLLALVPADAGGTPAAFLSKSFVGGAATIDCRFAMRVESVGSGVLHVATLSILPPPATGFAIANVELRAVLDALDLRLDTPMTDGGAFSIQRNLGPPLLGQWLDTRIRLSQLGTTPRIEIWLGGKSALDEAVTLPPVGTAILEIGVIDAVQSTDDMRVGFDDVMCDLAPP